jgi:SAM-dependent methyltransferase
LDPAEYDYMFKLEDGLWWYVGMRRIVDRLLQRHLAPAADEREILDAGCGTGGSLKQLQRYGRVTGFDFSEQATRLYTTRERGRVLTASADAMPFRDESFDLVTSFDVLCQLEPWQEEAALSELARVLRPGGTLITRVPAYQALYGPHDAAIRTRHRYTAGEMTNKIERSGLRPLQATYANALLLPIALARRLLAKRLGGRESDVRPVPAPLNALLQAVLALEAPLLARTSLPFGLSVMVVARKP